MVAAWVARGCSLSGMICGCSLGDMWLQPGWHVVAAWVTCGCSLGGMWLQPGWHGVAAWVACGCSLGGMRLQPGWHGVAGGVPHRPRAARAACCADRRHHGTGHARASTHTRGRRRGPRAARPPRSAWLGSGLGL
eukprot:scaffold44145_cov54-Phaeocystis_antarctica.AAC.1